MKSEYLQVLEKVAEGVSSYKWAVLETGTKLYKAIEFPIEAEDHMNSFYSEIDHELMIVVGAYRSRFYYEEENYTWEKKCYATLISTTLGGFNSISFITNEDVEDFRRQINSPFRKNPALSWGTHKKSEENVVNYLYDLVNREASGADNLINKFLGKFKTESQ